MPEHARSTNRSANGASYEAFFSRLTGTRRARGLTATLASLVALSLVACVSDRSTQERSAVGGAALNANPVLQDFVLYGERSVKLGSFVSVSGGDIGTRANAAPSFGAQLVVGEHVAVDSSTALIAPSVSLGANATVGDVETNSLINNGARFGAQASFPSSMPPLPLAGRAPSGQAVSVGGHQITSLTPGNYGAVSVAEHGALHLAPGAYSFASLTMGEHSYLDSTGSDVTLHVEGAVSLASYVALGDQNAKSDYLHIRCRLRFGDCSGGKHWRALAHRSRRGGAPREPRHRRSRQCERRLRGV